MTASPPSRHASPREDRGRNRFGQIGVMALPLLLFLIVVAAASLGIGRDPNRIPSPLIGQPPPAFSAPPLLGSGRAGVSQEDLLNGTPTLVNFWASWCVPCRQEHPQLMALAHDERWQLVGINYKDSASNAREFLEDLGNPFTRVGSDVRGGIAIDWGVYGIPETFIVDSEGRVRYKHIGPISPDVLAGSLLPMLASLSHPGSVIPGAASPQNARAPEPSEPPILSPIGTSPTNEGVVTDSRN